MKKLAARDFEDILQVGSVSLTCRVCKITDMISSLCLVFHPCFQRAPSQTVQWDATVVVIQDCGVACACKTPDAYRLNVGPPSRSHQGTQTPHVTFPRQDLRRIQHGRAPQQNRHEERGGEFVKKEKIELEHIQVPFTWRLCCKYPPLWNHRLILNTTGKPCPLSFHFLCCNLTFCRVNLCTVLSRGCMA